MEIEMRGHGFLDKERETRTPGGAGRPEAGVRANEETGRWTSADIAFFPFSHQSEVLRPLSGGRRDQGEKKKQTQRTTKIKSGFLKDFGFEQQIRG